MAAEDWKPDQVTKHTNTVEQESNVDDLWFEDGSCDDGIEKLDKAFEMEREWQRRHDQFHTIGYRDGLMAGKEASAQEGFNLGFKESVFVGYKLGVARGISSAVACLPEELKAIVVEKVEERNKIQHLHESLHSLPTTDATKL